MVSQFGELGRTSGMLKMPGPQVIHDLSPAGNRVSGGAHAKRAK
jgi:hypothetical protein